MIIPDHTTKSSSAFLTLFFHNKKAEIISALNTFNPTTSLYIIGGECISSGFDICTDDVVEAMFAAVAVAAAAAACI
jgi:hypothetical protein